MDDHLNKSVGSDCFTEEIEEQASEVSRNSVVRNNLNDMRVKYNKSQSHGQSGLNREISD